MFPTILRFKAALKDVLTSGLGVLAKDVMWEHNRTQQGCQLTAAPTSSGHMKDQMTIEVATAAARVVAQRVLIPEGVRLTTEALVASLTCALQSSAVGRFMKGVVDAVAEVLLEVLQRPGPLSSTLKRPREDPPVVRIGRFVRNAFRGPYVNQLCAQISSADDVSECESVVLLPKPNRRNGAATIADTATADNDVVVLSLATLKVYYNQQFPDKAESDRICEAHSAQFLANGVARWLRRCSRKDLEALGAALQLPPVSLQLATSLELVNFVTMSILPTPSVGEQLCQAQRALVCALSKEGGEALPSDVSQPNRSPVVGGGASLSAIGVQSRSLESAQRLMAESILYGAVRKTPEPFSRGELLHRVSGKLSLPMETIVAALAEMGSGRADELQLPCAPTLPTRDAFARMGADERRSLYREILRHQFRLLGASSSYDSTSRSGEPHAALEMLRAKHLVRIPLEALVVMVLATTTSDDYEQLMIRFYRIPFSPRTTKFELSQWVWIEEHIVLLGNLLSYVEEPERAAAIRAGKMRMRDLPVLLAMYEAKDESSSAVSPCSWNGAQLATAALFLLRKRNQAGP